MDNVGRMGTTALAMACTQGKEEAVRALVNVGGADVNLQSLAYLEIVPVNMPNSYFKQEPSL